jgi:hypothetical protein
MTTIETLLCEENEEIFRTKYKALLDECRTPEERNTIKTLCHARVYGIFTSKDSKASIANIVEQLNL